MRKVAYACLLLSVAVNTAYGYPSGEDVPPSVVADETVGLEKVYKVMQECSDKNMGTCLKMRALQYVDRVLRKSENIDVLDGVTLVKSESVESSRGLNGRSLSESELDDSPAKDDDEKDVQVENLLLDRVARFLESHTLQLKVPESSISGMRRSLDEGNTEFIIIIIIFLLSATILTDKQCARVSAEGLILLKYFTDLNYGCYNSVRQWSVRFRLRFP